MLSKRLIAPVAGALAIALIVAGCGGGGDDATASITKAEFVKQANAVCAKAQKQIQVEFNAYVKSLKGNEPKKPDEVAAAQADVVETVLIPAKQQQVEELEALGAPSGDDDQVEAIVDAFAGGVEKAEEDPTGTFNNETGAFDDGEGLAKKYGLGSC